VDTDILQKKKQLRETLRDFRARKLDMLIGTQMIAKCLDFPNVTLVGVLNADQALNLPDISAAERTFHLLTQVAGRAGRGEIKGEVFVQTFTPHTPAVQFSRHADFEGYADQECEQRKAFLSKAHGQYRFQLLMRTESIRALNRHVRAVLKNFTLPPEVILTCDVDPMQMM
jgi:primosomal protein N' (replication factor Y) (superfamily II helicase)